jgi:hypothetical protein
MAMVHDILWQNDNGQAGIWLMSGLTSPPKASLAPTRDHPDQVGGKSRPDLACEGRRPVQKRLVNIPSIKGRGKAGWRPKTDAIRAHGTT